MLINFLIALILDAIGRHGIANARRLPDIYWNSTNQMFDISNTDHVMSVKLLDSVTIVCPQPRMRPPIPYEYSKLYAVSRDGYDNCELIDERLIGVCQTPEQLSSISIVFRDFSPLPGALEFKPGHSYYFITRLGIRHCPGFGDETCSGWDASGIKLAISNMLHIDLIIFLATSDGTEKGIDRRSGGLCASEHMKIKFEVQSDRAEVNDYAEPSSAHFRHRLQNSAEVSTPLLYIIHTSDSSAEGYSALEDEGGAASSCQLNFLLLLVSLLFLYCCCTIGFSSTPQFA